MDLFTIWENILNLWSYIFDLDGRIIILEAKTDLWMVLLVIVTVGYGLLICGLANRIGKVEKTLKK